MRVPEIPKYIHIYIYDIFMYCTYNMYSIWCCATYIMNGIFVFDLTFILRKEETSYLRSFQICETDKHATANDHHCISIWRLISGK